MVCKPTYSDVNHGTPPSGAKGNYGKTLLNHGSTIIHRDTC